MNRRHLLAPWLVLAVFPVLAAPARADDSLAPKTLGFLQAERDYVIVFPEGSNVFKYSTGGVTTSSYKDAEGRTTPGQPVPWNATINLVIFHVVRFGGGSWALVQVPKKPEDYARWLGQRRAMAILASNRVEEIRAKPDGARRLKKIEQAAAEKIPTSEAWLNLGLAVAISDVPTDEVEPNLPIRGVRTNP